MSLFFSRITALFTSVMIFLFGVYPLPEKRIPVFDETQTGIHEKVKFDEGVAQVNKNDIVVATYGNDTNEGTQAEPLKTLEKAKEIAKTRSEDGAVTVWIHGGTYAFSSELSWNENDRQNIIYRSFPNEKVIFTGAQPIDNFTETTVNGVRAFVADISVYGENFDFNSLYKEGKQLKRPVYPKEGELVVTKVKSEDACADANSLFLPIGAFYGDSSKLSNFKNPTDIDVRVLHYWCDELMPIAKLDADKGRIEVQKPSSMTIEKGDRYILENVFEAMSQPNEWYLDKTDNKLYYIPESGETADTATLFMPVTKKFISLNNCRDISFSGISFMYSDWEMVSSKSYNGEKLYPEHYLSDNIKYSPTFPQACFDIPSAIDVNKSQNINFTNCKFEFIGFSAVSFGEECSYCSVNSSLFNHIGANAVNIMGPNEEARKTHHVSVKDCHIKSYGRVFNNAIGVFQTYGSDCEISNNEIHDGLYTAVSVGWTWGYADCVTNHNTIKENLIYDIGQGWLSDMGGIYTLGIQDGTVITGNLIHDVGCYGGDSGYGGWGIYLDEGSSNILVKNNLVYSCSSQGFHQHYGQDNILTNNIFAMNKDAQLRVTRKEDHTEFIATKNIFLSDDTLIYYDSTSKKGAFVDNGNFYWDLTRKHKVISNFDENFKRSGVAKMKRQGFYSDGVFADPLFKDARNFDFTLATNSPVFEAGFEAWDYYNAGTLTEF